MTTVTVQYAKTHLSALLARVHSGHEVVIARGDHPVAKLVPIAPKGRDLGFVAFTLPDDFSLDSLPEGEIDAWERFGD